jgi:hypothetical protein
MLNTVKMRKQAMARLRELDALAPKVRDMAPDFELRDINGGNPVRLSDFCGQKPVAMVFGSYT